MISSHGRVPLAEQEARREYLATCCVPAALRELEGAGATVTRLCRPQEAYRIQLGDVVATFWNSPRQSWSIETRGAGVEELVKHMLGDRP